MKRTLYLLLVLTLPGYAQRLVFRPDSLARVVQSGRTLTNAWAGGLNTAQYSRLRLDADTTLDLVVFDRAGQKVSTFLAVRQPGGGFAWRYAPQYEAQFPNDLSDWMLLVDYDGDGQRDLFTRTTLGVRVFRNVTTASGPLKWQLIADPVYTIGQSGVSNLYIASTDIPAITDLDGDGDTDILTFDISGNFVEFHRNESRETTGKPGLSFRKIDFCWGNFWKEHCRDFRFDIDCKTGRFANGRLTTANREEAVLHSGNSLLVTDLSGDGRKDALFGHITCQNVAFLPNTGTPQEALFQRVNYDFPTTQPILFQIFPAVFQEDFDFDGRPDLVAAPNTTINEGSLIDYRASNWFYQNTTSGPGPTQLTLRQNNFLQEGMIDLGVNAAPLLTDFDGDGDTDLLVGYGGIRGETGYRGGIALYRNVGTRTKPVFSWETDDYLGLAQRFLMTDVKPFVADLSGDGWPDLGFTANTFKGVEIRYVPNRGARGAAYVLSANEAALLTNPDNLRAGDIPVFYDVDGDGHIDVLVGKSYQNIEYHRNVGGSERPVFQLVTEEFGGTSVQFSVRNLSLLVADLNADGSDDLLLLNGNGSLRCFRNFAEGRTKTLMADSLLLDDGLNPAGIRRLGGAMTAAIADLDGDGRPDMILGTEAGGLQLLRNASELKEPTPGSASDVLIYPNPSTRFVYVKAPAEVEMSLFTTAGQLLLTRSVKAATETAVDLGTLPDGLYVVRISGLASGPVVRKVLVRQ